MCTKKKNNIEIVIFILECVQKNNKILKYKKNCIFLFFLFCATPKKDMMLIAIIFLFVTVYCIDFKLTEGVAKGKPCICIKYKNILNLSKHKAPVCNNNTYEGMSNIAILNVNVLNSVFFGSPICYEKPKNYNGDHVTVYSDQPMICSGQNLVFLEKNDAFELTLCSDLRDSYPNECVATWSDLNDNCTQNRIISSWKSTDTSYYAKGYTCGPSKDVQKGFLVKQFGDNRWKCITLNVPEFPNQTPFTFYSHSLRRAVVYAMKIFYPQETYVIRNSNSFHNCLKGDVVFPNDNCVNELFFIKHPVIMDAKSGIYAKNIDNYFDIVNGLVIPDKINDDLFLMLPKSDSTPTPHKEAPPVEVPAVYADPDTYRCGSSCYDPQGYLYKNKRGEWACVSPNSNGAGSHKAVSRYEQRALMSMMNDYYPNQPYVITFNATNGIECRNCLLGKKYYRSNVCPNDAWIWYDIGYKEFVTLDKSTLRCVEYKNIHISEINQIQVNETEVNVKPFHNCREVGKSFSGVSTDDDDDDEIDFIDNNGQQKHQRINLLFCIILFVIFQQ